MDFELDSFAQSVKDHSIQQDELPFEDKEALEIELSAILINSDPQECNNNLSLFLKLVVNYFCKVNEQSDSESSRNYHGLSIYGVKLLSSNLFTRNYRFCICKLLAFLEKFEELVKFDMKNGVEYKDRSLKFENRCFKEFICIITLLILKLVNSSDVLSNMSEEDQKQFKALVNRDELFNIFKEYDFMAIIANFIEAHILASKELESLFILLKLCGDIVFEYLYHIELLSDSEFEELTNSTNLIQTLINHLVNDDFNNYEIFGEFESEDKFIAYEEFKLLLLINEQYLMKSYSCQSIKNKVFYGLIECSGSEYHGEGSNFHDNKTITRFINLLIFHLNREESQIIKILILKFLYLIFTTSYTTKLMYLNDLKILVDIFIRELNNIDCISAVSSENRLLMITYLRVIYPMLMFSELSEVVGGYKSPELLHLFRTLVINLSKNSTSKTSVKEEQEELICNLAMRCASVSWLKNCNKRPPHPLSRTSSASSLTSDCDIDESRRVTQLNSSLHRVTSLRAASRSDYHKTVNSHNAHMEIDFTKQDHKINNQNYAYQDSKGNVFLHEEELLDSEVGPKTGDSQYSNLLDLPKEYLKKKPLPDPPMFRSRNSSSSSVNSVSQLVLKGMKKKAPAPPPLKRGIDLKQKQHLQYREMESHSPSPPPPPPPRNRRAKKLAKV